MKNSLSTLAVLCFLAVYAPHANADKPVLPYSYQEATADGKFVFVMLATEPFERDARYIPEEIRAIRENYKQSGLYRKDGSDIPLWTVDWWSHPTDIITDRVHLIRKNTSPYFDRNDISPRRYEQKVLSFFLNGKLLRAYRTDEIISYPYLLQHSASHFQWLDRDELDDARLRYKVWTKEGGWFDFDLTTGQVVGSAPVLLPPSKATKICIVLSTLLLWGIGAVLFWRKKLGPSSLSRNPN